LKRIRNNFCDRDFNGKEYIFSAIEVSFILIGMGVEYEIGRDHDERYDFRY
jgi:hypothetical protein